MALFIRCHVGTARISTVEPARELPGNGNISSSEMLSGSASRNIENGNVLVANPACSQITARLSAVKEKIEGENYSRLHKSEALQISAVSKNIHGEHERAPMVDGIADGYHALLLQHGLDKRKRQHREGREIAAKESIDFCKRFLSVSSSGMEKKDNSGFPPVPAQHVRSSDQGKRHIRKFISPGAADGGLDITTTSCAKRLVNDVNLNDTLIKAAITSCKCLCKVSNEKVKDEGTISPSLDIELHENSFSNYCNSALADAKSPFCFMSSRDEGEGYGADKEVSNREAQKLQLAPDCEKVEWDSLELPKFVISLCKEEIEDDFVAINGRKPRQRPKKRAKRVQQGIADLSPGMWLPDLTKKRYEVRERRSVQHNWKLLGLKSFCRK